MPYSLRACSLLLVLVVLPFVGCTTDLQEPANLSLQKQEIVRYVKSGAYDQDLATVAGQATTWIEQRVARRGPGERLAVVFDLDETLLLNWPQIRANDFGYVPKAWDEWVTESAAPAIGPVREVYQLAVQNKVEVIFITGRPEYQRADTAENLRKIGCEGYAELICSPNGRESSAAAFKTAARERLSAEGRVIIANLGDQWSDLMGGFAERTFKLPNPFYRTE